MIQLAAVFVGGGLGSLCRFGMSRAFMLLDMTYLPFATLASNLVSTLLLGTIMLKTSVLREDTWYFFLAVGFCGGFSTFSTFSFESFQLFKHGQVFYAILNIVVSVVLCLVLLFVLSKYYK